MSPEHLPFSNKETCLRGFVWLSGKYEFSVTFGRNKYITPYASCSESVILFLHLRTLTMALTGPEGGLLQSKIPACPLILKWKSILKHSSRLTCFTGFTNYKIVKVCSSSTCLKCMEYLPLNVTQAELKSIRRS